MSLTVKEYMARCKHKNVSIGAKDGSSYVYIGPSDFDGIFEAAMLFDDYHDRIESLYPRHKNDYQSFLKSNEFDTTTEEGLLAFGKRAGELYARFERSHRYLDTYIPLMDRKIIEKDMRESEEDNERIIVEGMEAGRFWTAKEYIIYKEDLNRKYIFESYFKRKIDSIILPEEDEAVKTKKYNKVVVVRGLIDLVEQLFDEGFVAYFKERLLYKPGMKITYRSAIQIVKEKITGYKKFQLGEEG